MSKNIKVEDIGFWSVIKESFKIGKNIMLADLILMLLIGILYNVFSIIGIYINKRIFDSIGLIFDYKVSVNHIIYLIVIYGICLIAEKSYTVLYKRYYIQYISLLKFEKKVKIILHKKCSKLPLEVYEIPEMYNYVKQAQNASINIYRIMEIIISIFSYLIGALFIGVYISQLDKKFAVFIVLAVIPSLAEKIYEALQKSLYVNKTTQAFREEETYRNTITSQEYYKETRILGATEYLKKIWERTFNDILQIEWKMYKKLSICKVFVNILKLIGSTGGFFLSAYLFMKGTISLGEFTASITAFGYLSNYSIELFDLFGYLSQFSTLVKPFFRFMNIENKAMEGLEYKFDQDIKLENVYFSYPGSEDYVIKDVNLEIKKGEKVAIVGMNGAGKTTLVNIILGLYTPMQGKVYYDNKNIVNLSEEILFKRKSAVFQKFNRYNFSLKENVILSNTYKKEDEKLFFNSLDKAKVKYKNEDVNKLLGREFGGSELSGGEWQRVAIARGFYRESDLIVLDEPTSAIDPIQEAYIYESFMKLIEDKTAILITHRLGAIKMVDRIIVLNNGQIAEQGTHNELIEKDLLYAKLWNSQVQWYT